VSVWRGGGEGERGASNCLCYGVAHRCLPVINISTWVPTRGLWPVRVACVGDAAWWLYSSQMALHLSQAGGGSVWAARSLRRCVCVCECVCVCAPVRGNGGTRQVKSWACGRHTPVNASTPPSDAVVRGKPHSGIAGVDWSRGMDHHWFRPRPFIARAPLTQLAANRRAPRVWS